MGWIMLMGLITLAILVWFGLKVFKDDAPQYGGAGGDSGASAGSQASASSNASSQSGSSNSSNSTDSSSSDASNAAASGASSNTSSSSGSNANAAGGAAASTGATAASAATVGAAVGAVAAVGASATAAANSAEADADDEFDFDATSGADIMAAGLGATGQAAGVSNAIEAGDGASVREMIKILNLRDSDASRLGIDADQFQALWQGQSNGVDGQTLADVSSRLQRMIG